ncbi:MAG: histidine phosphatase family protein [bacterium]|nr:histidine phosphatase family protein [bacterium]
MTLPIDLVLVRHGQSEGNAAKRLSEAGDHSAFTRDFLDRHSASLRLTDKGREQARQAGAFLREEFFKDWRGFDRCYTSEYIRAKETAGLLDLSGAEWYCDFYLTERDWGEMDICSEEERETKYGMEMRRRQIEPFFWRPPGGDRFVLVCLFVDKILETLHRECENKRVLIVCHGEVMRAFQVKLERMSQERFKRLTFSNLPTDKIYNCQIVHYTRRSPVDGTLAPYAGWVRWIRPTATPLQQTEWKKIVRQRYTNEQLLEVVNRVPAMIT